MNKYLLILKMIASQTPKCETQEVFRDKSSPKNAPFVNV